MSSSVMAAIVAAVASVAVSIFAWLTARRTSRAQAEYQRKLEALRLAHAEFAPAEAAANVLWEELQKLKHGLDILLVEGHPEVEDAVAAVRDVAYALSKDFAHQGPILPRRIQGLWHGIKNEARNVANVIDEYKDIGRYDRTIPLDEKGRILAIRHSLTESQRRLEKELAEHRLEVQKRYADLLRPGVEI